MARLIQRDLDILRSLDQFGQLDSGHIWRLHFARTCKSVRSLEHVRKRFIAHKLIAKLGRRAVKAGGAGSGKEVYQLGIEGARILGKKGTFRPRYSAVREHSLLIADAWTQLCEEEDAGRVKILGFLTEPDTHMKLAGVTVRPDLFVDIQLIEAGEQVRLWLEIDRDKENRPEIERKIRDYVTVRDNWREVLEVLDPIPQVLFLSESEIGRHNLAGYMKGKLGAWGEPETINGTAEWRGSFGIDDIQGWAERIE